jgi:arylsulfatase A
LKRSGNHSANAESEAVITQCSNDRIRAELTGQSLPKTAAGAEDSFSFLPALLGRQAVEPSRKALVLQSVDGTLAVRKGPWKWIEGVPAKQQGHPGVRGAEELYDLASDPGETRNVIQSHPEVTKALRTYLAALRDAVEK